MFFIGVFGIESKQKEIKFLESFPCKNCDGGRGSRIIKTLDLFQFFFIPLFRWNERYYIICNDCGAAYEIPQDKGKRIEKGENLEITYWDLKECNACGNVQRKCLRCGRTVDEDFEYCPYCGERIK